MNKPIVLLSGWTTAPGSDLHGSIQAGKTTIAKALESALNPSGAMRKARVYSFATLLRMQVRLSWPQYDWHDKTTPIEIDGHNYREILETVAAGYRSIDKYCYPRYLISTINPYETTIIDDCRTKDEFDFINTYCQNQKLEFYPILLHRNVETVRASSVEQGQYDYYRHCYNVDNNGTVQTTVNKIRDMVQI